MSWPAGEPAAEDYASDVLGLSWYDVARDDAPAPVYTCPECQQCALVVVADPDIETVLCFCCGFSDPSRNLAACSRAASRSSTRMAASTSASAGRVSSATEGVGGPESAGVEPCFSCGVATSRTKMSRWRSIPQEPGRHVRLPAVLVFWVAALDAVGR